MLPAAHKPQTHSDSQTEVEKSIFTNASTGLGAIIIDGIIYSLLEHDTDYTPIQMKCDMLCIL